ncbi:MULTISPECIES: hypothetical protein [Pacificibacter]|uniref:hypothetical protein n=1 Tax=Pacificibacter TaxID=1042323 RepID=UPI001C091132|nr:MULTISPECIES: hypothetical protein [Pacificibacter]MBU2936465.1 hypothetical protein [Pacificibacter marinus]MDO6614733.1 hypothetical protein [Pacificibacter sp. 1_MG-2023]
MVERPTLDDIQRESALFIGPPQPTQAPKMQRRLTVNDDIYVETFVTAYVIRTALDADLPIDPERLPHKIVEIIEMNGSGRDRPVIDGRAHYQVVDVIEALDIRNGKAVRD